MAGYVWDGSSWKTMGSAWTWNGTAWVQIKDGWAWVGSPASWKQIFSSGTFSPELRSPTTGLAITRRSVGLAVQLYRGSDVSGSYAYQFQYASGDQVSWSNQFGTNNSGTLTGATTTTNYTTDSTDLNVLENISTFGNNTGILNDVDTYRLQEAKNLYMRARVIKSGETQYTQNIRIHKRQPINSGTTLTLQRLSTGFTYTLTGNPATDKQPFVGDTIFWTLNFQNTTTITNDTRPDYYWFNFSANSGDTTRNSILSTPGSPRTPSLANRSYTVQSSDLGGPIVCNVRAINTNGDGTGDITIATRDVSDGTLTAPTNLVLQYTALSLVGTWDSAGGGNDGTITYTWYLERSISGGAYTQVASGNTTSLTFSNSQTTAARYRFYVVAAQTGNSNVTSGYSNVYELQAPAAFNVSIQNVTNTGTYQPSLFSINPPTLSSTVLNRWDWTWGGSTVTGPVYRQVGANGSTITTSQTPNIVTVNNWTSQITRPDSTVASANVTSATDYWTVSSSGNHTETVTANNNQKNYVRISWTKPLATSAVSYRVRWTAYVPSGVTNQVAYYGDVIVGDVTSIDLENTFNSNGAWVSGSNVLVTSVTAYNGDNGTGVSTLGTIPAFNQFGADGTTSWSPCNVVGTRQTSRVDNLTLENPQTGIIYITGTFEPGFAVSMTGISPTTGNTGWSPDFTDPGWSHVYKWYREGTVTFQQISGANSSSFVIPLSSAYIGDVLNASVVSTYKGQAFTERFDGTTNANSTVVPNPPTFTLSDNGNRTVSISGVNSVGATFYYGSYGGVGTGLTIPETAIATTSTSAQVSAGSMSATLNARRYVNIVYPSAQSNVQINSSRTTTNTITVNPSPQDTGSRRYLSSVYTVNPGTFFYISTNGYLGLQATTSGSSIAVPNDGSWLNIAQADLQQQYLYTLADSSGWWVRWRGNRLGNPSQVLEYQVYHPYNTGTCYVVFIENSISGYLPNTAWKSSGTTNSTWAGSSQDSTSNTLVIGTGSMTRLTTNDGVDDGVTSIQIVAPAVPMNSSPTVTRTAGGFTFNITNAVAGGGVSAGQFESLATYSQLVISGTATASINTSTGLVTVTGMTASSFATVRVAKTRTGYGTPPVIEVQGQALAGSPPSQQTAPSISATGTADTSGTVRRIQSGGSVSGSAGTYLNEQSRTSSLLTILSNAYTGSDSDWTSAGGVGTSVSVGDTAASSSANMYRWRDRVVGTDGSTVDFYSAVSYRAVYGSVPGVGFSSATTTSITLSYTGYAAQRVYRYRDGSQVDFFAPPASGPAVTTYSGLSAGTSYALLLYGGNAEGYLSVNGAGGTYSTNSNKLNTPVGVSASTTRTDGINISWGAVSGANYYGVWWGGAPGYDNAPDFPNITGTSYLDTSAPVGSRTYYVQAFTNSGNPAKSDWSSGATGTRASTPVGGTPGTPSVPSISYLGSGPYRWSATTTAGANTDSLEWTWQTSTSSGGAVTGGGTSITGATAGSSWSDSTNSWARVSVRGYNNAAGVYGPSSGFSAWA